MVTLWQCVTSVAVAEAAFDATQAQFVGGYRSRCCLVVHTTLLGSFTPHSSAL